MSRGVVILQGMAEQVSAQTGGPVAPTIEILCNQATAERMPDSIDLRWSGDWSGTLWRYLAFQQFGTVDVPWERVCVDDELREAFRLRCGRPGDEI